MMPQPDPKLLERVYSSIYRDSVYSIRISGNQKIDLPVQFPESANSFYRFGNILECEKLMEKRLNDQSFVIDLGGYQGMFLYAMRELFEIDGMVIDYNFKGIKFAKEALGFEKSIVMKNLFDIKPKVKANLVTMIHAFEHMDDPVAVLEHIKKSLLITRGYVYIEVPNLFGSPLSDPTHLFTFSEDSLQYILEVSGFEIVHMKVSGSKFAPIALSNSEYVISCLARSVEVAGLKVSKPLAPTVKQIQNRYRHHSRTALRLHLNLVFQQIAQLCYYTFCEFFLSILPGTLEPKIRWLKGKISLRFH